ncbi:MAG: Ig domain-containing protein [Nanoarchaeota archaeon]
MDKKQSMAIIPIVAIVCAMVILNGCDKLTEPLYQEDTAQDSQQSSSYNNNQLVVSDNQNPSVDGDQNPSGGPALQIPPGQTFTGAIVTRGAQTYYFVDNIPLRAQGGSPLSGYTWSVAHLSALPVGTAVDPLTGMFHSNGGQLMSGTHKFEMTVSDGSRTATGFFTFVVNKGDMVPVASFQQPAFDTIPLPDAKTGAGYGATLRAFGNGPLPWAWRLATGKLPEGMDISPTTGVVRGTPFSSTSGKTYEFTISVKDKDGKEAIIMAPSGSPPIYKISVPR